MMISSLSLADLVLIDSLSGLESDMDRSAEVPGGSGDQIHEEWHRCYFVFMLRSFVQASNLRFFVIEKWVVTCLYMFCFHRSNESQLGFSLWGVAEAVANSVKETANDIVSSVQDTDWKSELAMFSKTVQDDTLEFGIRTVRAVETLPDVMKTMIGSSKA